METERVIPPEFRYLSESEVFSRLDRARRALKDRAVILAHVYQRAEILRMADYSGDSLSLIKHGLSRSEARYVVVCGTRYLAESIRLLADPGQAVVAPYLRNVCHLADAPSLSQFRELWSEVLHAFPGKLVPVAHLGCSAEIKALVSEQSGALCTTGNAAAVLEWALERGDRALFFPDQHLGANAAHLAGVPPEHILSWDPEQPRGGENASGALPPLVVLWKGKCSIHQKFRLEQVEKMRKNFPGITILAHPACAPEVVRSADLCGPTEFIIHTIREAPLESSWAVGTEAQLVERLASESADRLVLPLSRTGCLCSAIRRDDARTLLWVLESLVEDHPVNPVKVGAATESSARSALQRMMACADNLPDPSFSSWQAH